MGIKIILVDDHSLLREGLCSLLGGSKNFEVVGQCADYSSAVQLAQETKVDVVIMNFTMSVRDCIDASNLIKAARAEVKLIGISMYSVHAFVLEALQAGFNGILFKDSSFEELQFAIGEVSRGRMFFSNSIMSLFFGGKLQSHKSQDEELVTKGLSQREKEVITHIANGMALKEIALRLDLCTKTVETHKKHILNKLGLSSIADITKFAIRTGLVGLE